MVATFNAVAADESITRRSLLITSHRAFLDADESGAALVAFSMHALEDASIADIAEVLDVAPAQAAAVIESSAPLDEAVLRRHETWLDDETRARLRARLGAGPESSNPGEDRMQAVPTRQGRRALAGVGAVIALLVALVVWLTVDDGSSRSSETTARLPGPAMLVTSTTAPGSTTTTPMAAPRVGYVVNDVPRGFVGTIATPRAGDSTGWFQLWASADAARATGRWIAIVVTREGDDASGSSSATATDESLGDDGVRQLTTNLVTGQQVAVESFGLTALEVSQIVQSISPAPDLQPGYGPDASAVLDGLDLRVSQATAFAEVGNQIAPIGAQSVQYRANDASGLAFFAVSGTQTADDLFVFELITQPVPNPLSTDGRAISDGGRDMVVGRFAGTDGGDHPIQAVQWHDGDHTVIVVGDVDVDVLVDAARTTEPATPEQWARLLTQ